MLWLALWAVAETLAIRQAGEVVNTIHGLEGARGPAPGFWRWVRGEPNPARPVPLEPGGRPR